MTDKLIVKFRGGRGGDGSIATRDLRPNGGDGGPGGDVYLVGSTHRYDLSYIDANKVYQAWQGDSGSSRKQDGKKGRDLEFALPHITKVYDAETDELITIVDQDSKPFKISEGGEGGYGNWILRREREKARPGAIKGKEGEFRKVRLVLNLVADVIFIGYPNAGKSSMLNALTNASAKVAHYEFTTIDPNLGIAGSHKLMDLPGLIEGTNEGKGLGTGFVKHTQYAKLMAHFLSLEHADEILDKYKSMRAELAKISDKLIELPEVIILTKSDLVDEEIITFAQEQLAELDREIIVTSSADMTYSTDLIEVFSRYLD